MNMDSGKVVLLLHAHLPFVRHPENEGFLEENWLFEAISETYLPLLRMLNRLEQDQVGSKLTFSISPTLAAMLQDEWLQQRYVAYCERMIELSHRELDRTRSDPAFHGVASMYAKLHESNLRDFTEQYERDLIRAFDYFYKRGKIEIMATAATHAYLPLYMQHPPAVRAQVQVGVEEHARVFGKPARGFWLPECGYAPGLEEYLDDQGIRYFMVATHGMVFGQHRPEAGVYAPTACENGLAVFGRDHAATNAVWSAEDGYPGDVTYRDFYRDIGHDLPLEYIGPFLPDGRIRMNTGFKYHAVTGKTDRKVPYDPLAASRTVLEHADNFVYNIKKRVARLAGLMDTAPVVTCPFDAELFGHWWFEGPQWIEAVVRRLDQEESLELITPHSYLKEYPPTQVSNPAFSSWGTKGYSEVWLDSSNDWVCRHVHKAVERMSELVARFPNESGLKQRALNQAARETLLAQASDWPFIMRAGTAVPYAVRRVKDHVANVSHVYDSLGRGAIGTEWLTRVERQHNLFPSIDYRVLSWDKPKSAFTISVPAISS
ncbi:MAG: glycoside hydrolase family 57 protein [Spirochaetota bacterium]